MKPTLKHRPDSYSFNDLLISFANGRPLSADRLNFIYQHEKALSGHTLDPVLKYYLKPYVKHKLAEEHNFLLHNHTLDRPAIVDLKRRLHIFLQEKKSHIELKLTPEQFTQFKALTLEELVLYHGNQYLTGAPFYAGGIPHHIYLQWGNLFGVAKYIILAEEKALKSNVLIHFEMMHERYIDQCIEEYQHTLRDELSGQKQLMLAHEHHVQQELQYKSIYQIPKLTLSINNEKHEEEN